MGNELTLEQVARFWSLVQCQDPDDCWYWIGGLFGGGYGLYMDRGAHRVSWEIENGPIPEGKWILHKCDVRGCVNPAHLYAGTPKENAEDMVRRGRWRNGGLRGETHPNAKITADQVREIRSLHGTMPTKEIAARYGITASQVSNIHARRAWKHIPEEDTE